MATEGRTDQETDEQENVPHALQTQCNCGKNPTVMLTRS